MVAETTDARQAQIQRMLESRAFRTSEVQRNLLQYLAQKSLAGEGDSVKEYTIGLDVFGKPDSFDPRQESSVRMHVARLRQKLAEYYRTEGTSDTVLVDLPKGGFRVVFEEKSGPEIAAIPDTDEGMRLGKPWQIGAALAIALVAAGITYFMVSARRSTAAGNSAATAASFADALSSDLAELWRPFFDSPRPILVCLAVGQDPAINAGTANGAFFLGQFLNPSRKREVVLTRSDQISMPEIAMDNVVFVGPTSSNRQIESIPMDANFVLDAKGVRNRKPQSGEPQYFVDQNPPAAGTPGETYALISHAPGLYGNGQILLLEGNHSSSVMAAVRSLTDPALGRMMTEAITEKGKLPKYFQVVLRVRSMDEMPVEVSYVAHRELTGKR